MNDGAALTNNAALTGGGVGISYGVFTMTGGEISGNTADGYGGGVFVDRDFTLGGSSVIVGNTSNNVYLWGDYITLSTDVPPAPDMYVGVQTGTPDGVIVQSGASAAVAAYFYADEPGKAVVFENGQLVIKDVPYTLSASPTYINFGTAQTPYVQPAAQTVTITKTGADSVTLTQPTSSSYDIGTLSPTTLTANGATATFTVSPKAGLPAGTYNETITIVGGGASATFSVSFTVIPAAFTYVAPAITSANSATAVSGTSRTFQVTATGTAPITYGISGVIPAGVSINSASGLITIAGTTAVGSHTFTITASNGTLPNAAQSFTLTVSQASAAFTISASPTSINFGTVQSPYTRPAARTVTITNTGTGSVTLTQPASANYEIGTLSTRTLASNGAAATFTVRPKADLPAGNYTEIITISGGGVSAAVGVSFTVTGKDARLIGISGLSFELNDYGEAVFVNTDRFGIEYDGEGNFYATLYDDTDTLTVHGVRYVIENVPAGALPECDIEKDGAVMPRSFYKAAAPLNNYFSVDEVTFSHGDRGVYKLYLGEALIGTFTVVYVNEANVADVLDVEQFDVDGVYYFAPFDLPAITSGNRYEIVSRPDTLGGKAVRINANGQLIFNQQAMPMNISRAGEYVVREVDAYGNVVNVYIITVY